MSAPREIPPAVTERQTDGVGSRALGLGLGQCRLRQDPCAGAARDPAAARRASTRRASSASPSPRPPPPTWRTACSTTCGPGPCSTTRRSTTPCADAGAEADRRRAARARAAAVRAGAGNAGRAEGADHPRLLHAAAASVSVRGQRRGALRGARRDHRNADARASSASTCCCKAAEAPDSRARPGAGPGRAGRRRRHVPRHGARGDPRSATS